MTDVELLEDIGRALWGERWRTPMATFLEIRRDTVQDWQQYRSPIPDFVWPRLYARLGGRQTQITKLIGLLDGRG